MVRNKRRSLFAIVGIVLALSLISGSLIAVDSSAYGILRSAIDSIPMDFVLQENVSPLQANASYFEPRIDALESVDDVTTAAPFVFLGAVNYLNAAGATMYEYASHGTIAFLPDDSTKIIESHHITGEGPRPGTVAICGEVASALNISVGGDIILSMNRQVFEGDGGNTTVRTAYLNLTFEVSEVWSQEVRPKDERFQSEVNVYAYSEDGTLSIFYSSNPVFLRLDDAPLVAAPLAAFDDSLSFTVDYFVWIDRGSIISLADVPGTLDNLEFIGDRISAGVAAYGLTLGWNLLADPIDSLRPQLGEMKSLFVALALPVIALGTYLSIVGVDLGVSKRKQEVGMLKSRGASNGHILWTLLTESFILGASAGLLGLLAGIVMSRFLLGAILDVSGDSAASDVSDISITGSTVVISVLFGICLMLLSSYTPFRKMARIDVAEALHHHTPSILRVEYRPRIDLIMLGLVGLSVASIMVGPDWVLERNWSWITQSVLIVAFMLGLAILPLIPFMLSLSVVRLLTRGSRRVYVRFTRLVRPWTKELHHLVDRNIVRNPKRASNLCLIVSLAIAFGLFVSITMESSLAYQRELVEFEVGSDVKAVGVHRAYTPSDIPDLGWMSALDEIEGVEQSSVFMELYAMVYDSPFGGSSDMITVIDTSSYLDVVRPSDYYFDADADKVLDGLKANGTVLASEDFLERTGLYVGDTIMALLTADYWQNGTGAVFEYSLYLEIIGSVRGAPGFPQSGYGGNLIVDWNSVGFIPLEHLASTSSSTKVGAFFEIEGGWDPEESAAGVRSVFEAEGFEAEVLTRDAEIADVTSEPTFGSMNDFLYTEYAFSLLIMSVGVSLIIFVAVTDRETELACIMARGASSGQMRKILMGESFTLMIIGLLVGASTGLLTAYLFNRLTTETMYTVVEHQMALTSVSLVVVIVSVCSLVLASLVATARAGRIRLSEVLRIRGG